MAHEPTRLFVDARPLALAGPGDVEYFDVFDLVINNAPSMEREINNITGVVTNGLFAQKPADVLLIGTSNGVEIRK